jgi:cytochrome c-type biogenesis protein
MLENINLYINQAPVLAYLLVFAGGLIFGLAPCAMAIIPLTIGFVGGYAGGNIKRAFGYSLCFVLGFVLMLTSLGITAALLGKYMGNLGKGWYLFLALVAILMGLNLLGVFNINLPGLQLKTQRQGGWAAFLLGLGFGIISTPCSTPILIILLAVVAIKGKLLYGGTLLLTYALGQSALILAAGTFIGVVDKLAQSKGLSWFSNFIKKASGILVILVGIYLFLKYI